MSICVPSSSVTSLMSLIEAKWPLKVFRTAPFLGSITEMSPSVDAAIRQFVFTFENRSLVKPPYWPTCTVRRWVKFVISYTWILLSIPAEQAIGYVEEIAIDSTESVCYPITPFISPVMYCDAKTFPSSSPERITGISGCKAKHRIWLSWKIFLEPCP